MTDKEDKTVRQFVLFCRTALMYEKKNYYNEHKHRAERETHIEMLSPKQSGMLEKIFDTYLKAESARIKHDLAENDAILGELAEIADKAAMVQRAKEKQKEILPNLGEQKSAKKERGNYGRE